MTTEVEEPNTWEARGIMPKDKMAALCFALWETIKGYPEPNFKFDIAIEGIPAKRGNIDRSMCKPHKLEADGSSPSPSTSVKKED